MRFVFAGFDCVSWLAGWLDGLFVCDTCLMDMFVTCGCLDD